LSWMTPCLLMPRIARVLAAVRIYQLEHEGRGVLEVRDVARGSEMLRCTGDAQVHKRSAAAWLLE